MVCCHWSCLLSVILDLLLDVAVMFPNGTFSESVDGEVVLSGSLAATDLFESPLLPPETIIDPADSKPADWIDDELVRVLTLVLLCACINLTLSA